VKKQARTIFYRHQKEAELKKEGTVCWTITRRREVHSLQKQRVKRKEGEMKLGTWRESKKRLKEAKRKR